MQQPKTTSDTAIKKDKGSHKITHRLSTGTAKRLSKDMPQPKVISAYVMQKG